MAGMQWPQCEDEGDWNNSPDEQGEVVRAWVESTRALNTIRTDEPVSKDPLSQRKGRYRRRPQYQCKSKSPIGVITTCDESRQQEPRDRFDDDLPPLAPGRVRVGRRHRRDRSDDAEGHRSNNKTIKLNTHSGTGWVVTVRINMPRTKHPPEEGK